MSCRRCGADTLKDFNGELAIHFPGLQGLETPIVWVFPTISVCLDCGVAQFMVPEREVEVLRTGVPVEGANVWLGNHDREKAS